MGDPVQSLGQEDSLENGMAIHSSIPGCRIPWTEEPGGLQSTGSQRVGHDWATKTFTFHAKVHTICTYTYISIYNPTHCCYCYFVQIVLLDKLRIRKMFLFYLHFFPWCSSFIYEDPTFWSILFFSVSSKFLLTFPKGSSTCNNCPVFAWESIYFSFTFDG